MTYRDAASGRAIQAPAMQRQTKGMQRAVKGLLSSRGWAWIAHLRREQRRSSTARLERAANESGCSHASFSPGMNILDSRTRPYSYLCIHILGSAAFHPPPQWTQALSEEKPACTVWIRLFCGQNSFECSSPCSVLSLPRRPTSPRVPRASPPRPGAAATASRRRARHRGASSTCRPRRSTRRSSPAASSPQSRARR